MKGTTHPPGVTFWKERGIYRKVVGGRCFFFGEDPAAAAAEATALKAAWRQYKAAGHSTWPQGQPDRAAIRQALGLAAGVIALPAAMPAPHGRSGVATPTAGAVAVPAPLNAEELVSPENLTLAQAANVYFDEVAKSDAGDHWRKDVQFRLGKALDSLGRKKPIGAIGQLELVNFAAHWRARPFRINQDGTTSTERIGWLYASRIVAAAKSFLSWASDHPDIQWRKPPRFDSILLLKPDKPRTAQERRAFKAKVWEEGERFFEVDELRALYRVADTQFKAFILLGLNCAYGPSEIAALMAEDIQTADRPCIRTVRPKTGEKSLHYLWPETAKAIEAAKAKPNPDGLVFLTERGKPVASRKYNMFPHAWDEIREAAKLPDAPAFKALRKTSANAIRKLAGEEVADVHLAHAEKLKMIGPYADKLWEQHREATAKLRRTFKRVWS